MEIAKCGFHRKDSPMSLPRVFVTVHVPLEHLSPLAGLAEIVMPDYGMSAVPRAKVLDQIGNCVGVLSQGDLRVDAELLEVATSLRIVANAAMGIDNLDLTELRRLGIAASHTPDAFAESTADHALGLLLAVTRRTVEGDRFIRTGEWPKRGREPLRWEGMLLRGKTLGLLGYGRIGQRVELRAKAFGMQVIHTKLTPHSHPGYRPIDQLLSEADAIIILVPLTERTFHLVDQSFLSRMKSGAYLLNLARGKVMDESAVVDALRTGHLGGAALDVFEAEPVVNEALFTMENVVLTPHVGGATHEERRRGRLEASGEIARFLRGEERLFSIL